MGPNNLEYFLCVAEPAAKVSLTKHTVGYNRPCIDPLPLGEHWILSVTARQSWEAPLYRLMVIKQIEEQAVSWQTLRTMSVSPLASFPATSYFTSQNYFYFHLSEVLILWPQGWFWCVQLPKVRGISPKSQAHTTAKARLQTCHLQIRFWGMQILTSYQSRKLAGALRPHQLLSSLFH